MGKYDHCTYYFLIHTLRRKFRSFIFFFYHMWLTQSGVGNAVNYFNRIWRWLQNDVNVILSQFIHCMNVIPLYLSIDSDPEMRGAAT